MHDRICPQCCGEAREVTIDCPTDCVYLQQAREHEKPREADQLDPAALFAQVEVPRQFVYENEHLLVGLSFALAKAVRADRALNDQDLIAALSAAIRTYETLANSGLHYQVSPGSLGQQAVVGELEKTLKEYREVEQKHRGFSSLRDSDVLRALVFLVRMAHARTSGRPKSRALIDSLFAQFPEKESLIETPASSPSRIIMP
ncbi:MAG TPA: hypothetical protein VL177_03400 [Terriglobales bacterium]|nr:hypothetical protein [Terriglobales bacterium]